MHNLLKIQIHEKWWRESRGDWGKKATTPMKHARDNWNTRSLSRKKYPWPLWCSKLSQCQAGSFLPIQLSANGLGNATQEGPSARASATHVENILSSFKLSNVYLYKLILKFTTIWKAVWIYKAVCSISITLWDNELKLRNPGCSMCYIQNSN